VEQVSQQRPSVAARVGDLHEASPKRFEKSAAIFVLTDEHGCQFDKAKEKEASFLAAELLVPYQAALKAAFAEKTNEEIAAAYGISTQFAQMRMAGARKHAARALVRQPHFAS
jgi:Zn-dependent peptidase ImmA (M78 family)